MNAIALKRMAEDMRSHLGSMWRGLLLCVLLLCILTQGSSADETTKPPRKVLSMQEALQREQELMTDPAPTPVPVAAPVPEPVPASKISPMPARNLSLRMDRDVFKEHVSHAESTFQQIQLALLFNRTLRDVRDGLREHLASLKLNGPLPPPDRVPPLEPGDDAETVPNVWQESDVPQFRARLERIQAANDALQTSILAMEHTEMNLSDEVRSTDIAGISRIPDGIRDKAKQAEQVFAEGDSAKAALIYQECLDQYPTSLYLLSNLGVVRLTQGNLAAAETLLRKSVEQAPFDAFSHSLLGIVSFQQQKDMEALRLLLRAVCLAPNDPKTRNYLALVISKKRWHVAAEAQLRRALELYPNYAEAHYNLAVLYALSPTPFVTLAAQHYRRARELGAAQNEELESILVKSGVDLSTFPTSHS